MKLIVFLLASLLLSTNCYAALATAHTVYGVNSQVTSTTLNGNVTALLNAVNGGLDNDNADTSSGYRFYEVRSSLPAAGTQGRVVYNTTDDSLNFDNGSTYTATFTLSGTPAQGDIIYYNGSSWTMLTAGTANYPLVTNGAGANPAYEQLPDTSLQTISTAGKVSSTAISGLLGAWVDKSGGYGAQQATTDGFVVFHSVATDPNAVQILFDGYTDGNADPTTIRANGYLRGAATWDAGYCNFMFPVKKDDYWKVVKTVTSGTSTDKVYWIPLGS